MLEHDSAQRICPQCGEQTTVDQLVCPACRTILIAPGGRKKTPLWVIAALLVVIAVLCVYAAWLAWQVLVLHKL